MKKAKRLKKRIKELDKEIGALDADILEIKIEKRGLEAEHKQAKHLLTGEAGALSFTMAWPK
jgi:hypothetical protein